MKEFSTAPPVRKFFYMLGDRHVEFRKPLYVRTIFFWKGKIEMPRKGKTYNQLLKMAKQYGVDKNALFIQAVEQYTVQCEIIRKIKDVLNNETDLLTEKEYVKGRENIYVNPLVKELPKHADSATKSLGAMLDIIEKLGRPAKPEGKLSELMKSE